MDLCSELALARKEVGLSQKALAEKLRVPRLRVARMESGTGSVELLIKLMSAISMRVTGVAKGSTIVEQIKNARLRRGWSVEQYAEKASADVRTVKAIESGQGTVKCLCAILRAVAPKAERQATSRANFDYDRARRSETDSRFTPPDFLDEIVRAFGEITLDPCSHADAPIQAKRKIILPENGLTADWASEGLVWINPPFSHLAPWLAKANEAWAAKQVKKMVFLLPASRLDLRAYFDEASKESTTLLLRERLRFVRPDGMAENRAPFALCLVCWGCSDKELAAFCEMVAAIQLR